MLTDRNTHFVYFSSLLKNESRYRPFWNRLKPILESESIPYGFLEGTKDIWCRDYMPVQVAQNDFVQFRYLPDYCNNPKWQHKLTQPEEVRLDLDPKPFISDLIIDGGNIVKGKNAAILTDKVFKENPGADKAEVVNMLRGQLQTQELFFIPKQPYDMTGHADGMLRFLDDRTLLVSDYQGESESWKKKYAAAIKAINLEVVVLPSVALDDRNDYGDYTARGCYINFAQIDNKILLPFFDLEEDELVRKEMQRLYPDCKLLPVAANEIAQDGGGLNCITWNIKR